jgi:hypothetical protein
MDTDLLPMTYAQATHLFTSKELSQTGKQTE